MAESQFIVENYAGVGVVTLTSSSLLDSLAIDQLGKELYRLVDEKNMQKLVVDFCNVKLLSSHALGVLITLNKKSGAIKGKLALCGMKPELMKVFTITNLDKVFKFFPDDAAALKSFGVSVK